MTVLRLHLDQSSFWIAIKFAGGSRSFRHPAQVFSATRFLQIDHVDVISLFEQEYRTIEMVNSGAPILADFTSNKQGYLNCCEGISEPGSRVLYSKERGGLSWV
jgi:hypothetical protein